MNVNNSYFCFILVEYSSFHHTKPRELVEKVNTDEFLNTCVAATNDHGEDDEEFTRIYLGGIPEDESGRALLKAYLAIEWYLSL